MSYCYNYRSCHLFVSKTSLYAPLIFTKELFAFFSYHIYKQNLNRMNNNSPRVNNNNLHPPPAARQPQVQGAENNNANENVARSSNGETVAAGPSNQDNAENIDNTNTDESRELISNENTQNENNTNNSVLAFLRTFVLSFFASIIPEAPGL